MYLGVSVVSGEGGGLDEGIPEEIRAMSNGEVEGPHDHAGQATRAHNLLQRPRRHYGLSRPPPTIVRPHRRSFGAIQPTQPSTTQRLLLARCSKQLSRARRPGAQARVLAPSRPDELPQGKLAPTWRGHQGLPG